MYKVFNMGHRMEFYVPEIIADAIIAIAGEFNIDAADHRAVRSL